MEVDHYEVLGLPSGEEGAKLTEKEISKAYRVKALELHPDKRPDDPNAQSNFQKLKSSYELLKDDKARKLFDDLLRARREHAARRSHHDSKRRRMVDDLERREKSAFAPDPEAAQRQEEERIAKKLKEEIERIRAMMSSQRGANPSEAQRRERRDASMAGGGGIGSIDKERLLKVSWEKVAGGEDYSSSKLKEIFSEFGEVEDVVMKSSKKKGSALVLMTTREAVVAATRNMCGSLSNPLLVVPLKAAAGSTDFLSARAQQSMESDPLNDLKGFGHKAYEDSVFEKIRKATESKKQD